MVTQLFCYQGQHKYVFSVCVCERSCPDCGTLICCILLFLEDLELFLLACKLNDQ